MMMFPRYDTVELAFEGADRLPIGAEPPFSVRLRNGGDELVVPAFWDGGTTYRVRIGPET
ncbi:DUF5060 domain-containing protein, partial [Bacillus sp. SIMBA_008]|uniref:DUF5060 domain-containing protein n=1 Tax=Bacillus sp. SIMBA_008 TaxID=3085757 RepID=UPI00397958E6